MLESLLGSKIDTSGVTGLETQRWAPPSLQSVFDAAKGRVKDSDPYVGSQAVDELGLRFMEHLLQAVHVSAHVSGDCIETKAGRVKVLTLTPYQWEAEIPLDRPNFDFVAIVQVTGILAIFDAGNGEIYKIDSQHNLVSHPTYSEPEYQPKPSQRVARLGLVTWIRSADIPTKWRENWQRPQNVMTGYAFDLRQAETDIEHSPLSFVAALMEARS